MSWGGFTKLGKEGVEMLLDGRQLLLNRLGKLLKFARVAAQDAVSRVEQAFHDVADVDLIHVVLMGHVLSPVNPAPYQMGDGRAT